MVSINLPMQARPGRTWACVTAFRLVASLSIQKMKTKSSLQCSVILTEPTPNAEFTERKMEELRGRKFFIKMKTPVPFRSPLIQITQTLFMPTYGPHDKFHGKMDSGKAPKAACINQLMVVQPGTSSQKDYRL